MKPVAITNTFATQTGPIPLSELDTNFSSLATSINDMATYSNYLQDLSGSANQITVTTAVGIAFAYSTGMLLQVLLANTNTSTTVNINVNGLGNQLVLANSGAAPGIGSLTAGSILLLQYNGTDFLLLGSSVSNGIFPSVVVGSPTGGNQGTGSINATAVLINGTNLYAGVPQNLQSGTTYTLALTDNGQSVVMNSGSAHTLTIPANASIAFPIGACVTLINTSSVAMSVAITSDTLNWSPAGTTGTRTLAQYAVATIIKVAATTWYMSGTGIT
jgi:hypothetical protein